jgi:hypothetical protein
LVFVLMPATFELRDSSISTTGYVDGLGRRTIRFDREAGSTLECLLVRPELRAYEDMLLERACAVSELGDRRFMHVRSLEREHGRLVVISDLAPGSRLSDLIDSRTVGVPSAGVDAALGFLLQVLPALARLHEASLVHGTVAPGRIIVSHSGEIVLADVIYSSALSRINLSRRRLWVDLDVAFPAHPPARAPYADVAQATLCAISIALGQVNRFFDPLEAAPAVLDELVDLAANSRGDRFAADLRGLFEALLLQKGSSSHLTAAQALERALALATREFGEDACAKALLEYVRSDGQEAPAAAAESAAAEPSTAAVVPATAVPVDAAKPPAAVAVTADPKPAKLAIAVKTEPPAGYLPPRTMFGVTEGAESVPEPAKAASSLDRGLAFLKAAPASWKIAAALAVVILIGLTAGGGSLKGDNRPAVEAPGAPAAAAPVPAPAPAAAPTGALTVETQPAGAKVLVDGLLAGLTPLKLDAVAPGRHSVTVITETGSTKRTVRVEAGKTAALDLAVFSGWVVIHAPFVLDVSEGKQGLGTTENGKILLAPGNHTLTVSNRDLDYSSVQRVQIRAGEEAVINVAPTGQVNLNAQPWAEVWIDGARAGETPIANLKVPLGTREFIFKHPQFGERKVTATVTTKPSALSVDFNKSSQ